MSFVQIIEYKSSHHDEIDELMDKWIATTQGTRTPTRSISCRDRDSDGTYVEIVEFPSFDVAMANSELPETDEFAKRMQDLCDGPATFRNLDVLRVDEL